MSPATVKPIALIACAMLVAGVLPIWPYEYYMLLRVVACAAGGVCAWLLWTEKQGPAIALAVLAVLFNPFVPVHLTRGLWAIFDLAGGAVFAWAAFTRPPN